MKRMRMARLSGRGLAVAAGVAVLAALGPAAGTAAAAQEGSEGSEGSTNEPQPGYTCAGTEELGDLAATVVVGFAIEFAYCNPIDGAPLTGPINQPFQIKDVAGNGYVCESGFANAPAEVFGINCRDLDEVFES